MHLADDYAIALTDVLELSNRRRFDEPRCAHIQHPLLQAASNVVFESLATPAALAQNFRLLEADRQLPRERWVSSRMGEGEVLHTELDSLFIDTGVADDGLLLAIDSIDEHNMLLLRVREMLEYTIGARGWINVYITATDASSFGPHSDAQHTVIVQLFGRKQWTVCSEPTTDDVIRWDRASTSTLSPGDVLYVPAATGHDVVGIGELSVHLTIGFDPDCWLPAQVDELGALLGRSLAPPTSDEITGALAMIPERRRGTCLPFRHSHSLEDAAQVRWASRLPPRVEDGDEPGVEVTSMGRTHRFSARWRACITELARGRELTGEELLELAGGDHKALRTFLMTASSAGLVLVKPPVHQPVR